MEGQVSGVGCRVPSAEEQVSGARFQVSGARILISSRVKNVETPVPLPWGEGGPLSGASPARQPTGPGEGLLGHIPSGPKGTCFVAHCSIPPEVWAQPHVGLPPPKPVRLTPISGLELRQQSLLDGSL